MAVNYDLNNTGPEVQERLDQVPQNESNIAIERQARIDGDAAVTTECKGYTDAEGARAVAAESNLQAQIDVIVSGQTTVSLKARALPDGAAASTVAVFADGEDKAIELIATSDPTPADVNIDGIGSAESIRRKTFEVTVNGEEQETMEYTAVFTVAGVSKGTKTARVALVYPIFYGAGATLAGATIVQESVAKTSPDGVYGIETEAGDHLFFEVPSGMSIHRVQLWDNPDFPTDVAIESQETERTGADGSAYVAYRSVSTFAAGNHDFKLS